MAKSDPNRNEIMMPKGMAEEARKMREQGMKEKRESAKPKGIASDDEDIGYKKGGTVSSASKRADGCVMKGKTRGRFV